MKILLCAIVKNENRYLNDWVTYHKELGFDDILIYDNNDSEVITNKDVNVINCRGLRGVQNKVYNDCYRNHSSNYDWVAYFDIDEYLCIDINIKEFLLPFEGVDAILINWEIYGDNGLLHYEDIPVIERFKEPSKFQTNYVKSIVRTNNPNFIEMDVHNAIIYNGKYVYPNMLSTKPFYTLKPNFEGAKIKHYYTKTIEEWIDRKYLLTDVLGEDHKNGTSRIREFFLYNDKTLDKLNIIKKYV